MKAVRIHAYGHSDQIQVEDVSEPTVDAGDVLVKIRDAGINPVDWKIREGYMAKVAPRTFPFTLGQDFAGEVVKVGDVVTGFAAGGQIFGFVSGAYAEYAVASPSTIARAPRTIDAATAAGLPTPGLTALQVVRDVIAPRQRQTVLIHGAAGGVGSIATQLCIGRGARVIATAAREDDEYLRQLGVDRVIDYKTTRFEDQVESVDAVIALVGGDTIARSLQVIARGGVLAATVGDIDDKEAARRGVRAVRFVMQKNAADLAEIARLVDSGALKPRPARVMPLTAAKTAQELLESGKVTDKVVLSAA